MVGRRLAAVGVLVASVVLGFLGAQGAAAQEAREQPDVCDTAAGEASTEFGPEAEALALRFQDVLDRLARDAGLDASGVPDLLGEPGDSDLPPGAASVLSAVDAVCAADGPGGGGSKLTGPCQGIALSFTGAGQPLDAAADFSDAGPPIDLRSVRDGRAAVAFTASNPFEVDVNGHVLYMGVAGPPGGGPTNHTWTIRSLGVSIDSGGDDNPDAENASVGSVDLGADFPLKINGLFYISGNMAADGGFLCDGFGYFRTVGGQPIALIAGAVILVGAVGFGALFNTRPSITTQSTNVGL